MAHDPELGRVHADVARPRRTPATMSRRVPRSEARLSTDGARPRSVSGAPATMPHDARCSSSRNSGRSGEPVVTEATPGVQT